MKFVHAADIHLDSPLRGLERYEGAPIGKMRQATRDALKNLVTLCLDEAVDVLLIAGDLYDGNWRDYGTGLFFAAQMSLLRAASIRVVVLRGNHDAASLITKNLRLPDNVTEIGFKEPETIRIEELNLAIHGQSFATKAVTQDLSLRYPDAIAGALNIGMLHTSAGGREGHENYAPCSIATLKSKGYDYWALGHVHTREVLCEEPWILFPGNLQGRHARETGAKGATLVSAEGNRITAVEHRPLDVVRWASCEIDATNAASPDDVVDLVRNRLTEIVQQADGRPVAARVVLAGATEAHAALEREADALRAQIRAVANDVDGVWVEKILLETRLPVSIDELAQRDDAIGQLARSMARLQTEDAELAPLADELAELRFKLPPELREGDDGVRIDDPAYLRRVMKDVEQILLPRLLVRGEER